MFRKTVVRIVLLIVVVSLSGADLMAQKRIRFRKGASAATVRGNIGPDGYTEYLINGREGQLMSIEITSGNGAVVVNAGTASGKSFSITMTGGDHLLSIVNTKGRTTNYTLKVSIRY